MSESTTSKPSLIVVVPSLRELEFSRSLADYPAILRFLSRSRHKTSVLQSAEQALLHYFGYAQVAIGELPAGICSLGADTTEEFGQIARADPVYVKAEPDHASIHSAAALQLSAEDAQMLVAGLNSHFNEIGCRFHLGDTWRWHLTGAELGGAEGTTLLAEPLNQVADRNVVSFLDPERHPVEWRRLLTEIQMVLHSLPVNIERMERGLQPVNSLWAWGAHPMPERQTTPEICCYAEDAFARGLCQISGIENLPLSQEPSCGDQQSILLCSRVLETLLLRQVVASPGDFSSDLQMTEAYSESASQNDPGSVQGGLQWLEKNLAWGMSQLLRGRLGDIHLVPCDGEVLKMRRIDLLRFWQRRR